MRRSMHGNTKESEAIYDPFLGSGKSLIAAETCGRLSCTIEIDPRCVDVAAYPIQSPYVAIANRLAEIMMRLRLGVWLYTRKPAQDCDARAGRADTV